MARERKPLIEPGSVLAASDTLTRILERDRAQAGRRSPGASASEAAEKQRNEDITSNITAHISAQQETKKAMQPRRRKAAPVSVQEVAREDAHDEAKHLGLRTASDKASPMGHPPGQTNVPQTEDRPSGRAEGVANADLRQTVRRMGKSRPIPITLRLPEELNDWLDDYAHVHRKRGIKKQDLVARAVQLLILDLNRPEATSGTNKEDE